MIEWKWFIPVLLIAACRPDAVPKPRGYFRIEHPNAIYRLIKSDCPVQFELPQFALIERVSGPCGSDSSCCFNIAYPTMNARWLVTYIKIDESGLDPLVEQAHNTAFAHDIKASGIGRKRFSFPENDVHGVLFELDGPVASPLQFFATDSTNSFIRGALFFNHVPNPDSLSPSLEQVRENTIHLLETLEWKAQ
jgi:gliding motility-associated lipoprotein GldD